MTAVEKREGYTPEQIGDARKLIEILMRVPEEKKMLFTAVVTAYMDGVEAGTRITREMEGTAV